MKSPYQNILFPQCIAFLEMLFEASNANKSFLKKRYSQKHNNFDDVCGLFLLTGIIKETDNRHLAFNVKKLFSTYTVELAVRPDILKTTFLNLAKENKSQAGKEINQFIQKFTYSNGQYEFRPDLSQRLAYTHVRNFLISAGIIKHENKTSPYRISHEYISFVEQLCRPIHFVSPTVLAKKLLENDRIGKLAEKVVFLYEQQRLSKYPYLIPQINHISLVNTACGYDILSFEEPLDCFNKIERFIEVKAVSIEDYGFFFTRNELLQAESLRDRYYLYLLPAFRNSFSIPDLKIFRDPYISVFSNTATWDKHVELYSLSIK